MIRIVRNHALGQVLSECSKERKPFLQLNAIMIDQFFFVPLLFISFIACTSEIASDANPSPSVSLQAIFARQSSTAPAKTTTIQVSGKPQTIPLGLVQTPYFSTYFPTDRFVLDSSSADSGDIKFYWKRPDGTVSKNTLIGFIFYSKNQKLRDVKTTVDGFALAAFEPQGARKVEQSPAISYAKKTYSTWLRDLTRLEIRKSPNVADPKDCSESKLEMPSMQRTAV